MCIFLARFGMHGIACGSFSIMAWVFLGVSMSSAQPFHFQIAMVGWASHVLVELDCYMDQKLGEADICMIENMAQWSLKQIVDHCKATDLVTLDPDYGLR